MNIRMIISQMRKYKRVMIVATTLTFLFSVSTAAWLSLIVQHQPPVVQVASSGWGQEAIGGVKEYVAALSPIASANACGMGASSCFKCHNGMRAPAAIMDPKTAPWHFNHESVNGDCVGCHKGKERLVKKELAHEGLIKDPRLAVSETCDTCHKSGNSAELVKRYL